MHIESGQTLLHYRIVDKLGEGGMGVVWRAVDTTLDREVAIKLVPAAFSGDPERLARFEREAKTLAALNHPNIAGIFGLHEIASDDGTSIRFLAMELVQGEDLAQRIARGALPVPEAVALARAIAEALSAAHAIGVVHRDLKPANVMLTPDGQPKVLDFGLAKVAGPDAASGGRVSASFSPTVTSLGTAAHVILGTAGYMAPEQARGNAVDRRADIWALGAVLYEMLTGKAPFDGETISDTLASVLKTEPDWDALPAATPASVHRLLRRSLEKDPRRRLHDAADARIELDETLDEASPDALAAEAPARRSLGLSLAIGVLALLAGLVIGLVATGGGTETTVRAPIVSELRAPEGVTIDLRQLSLALSPDGEQLAFVGIDPEGRAHLYVRRLDAAEAIRLDETDGAATPFWSPDGRQIGYYSAGRLLSVPADGGAPRTICETSGRHGAWSTSGTILIGAGVELNGPLLRVEASGGTPQVLAGTGGGPGTYAMAPQFLPDGRRFIYQREDLARRGNATILGSLDSSDVVTLREGIWNSVYADGHLFFIRETELMAQRFDLDAGRLVGEARRVAGPVVRLNYPFHGFFDVAPAGDRLVYLHGEQAAGLAETVWVDRSGDEIERPGIRGDLYNPRLSRDGRRLAIDVSTNETYGDIWIFDLDRGSSRRLTRDPVDESRPTWMPGDARIAFFRIPDLYTIAAAGDAQAELLLKDEEDKYLLDVSPDGRHMLYSVSTGDDSALRVLDTDSGETRDWLEGVHLGDARFSPDGRWIAFVGAESGTREIYIDRFPTPDERFRVSVDGGSWPVWRQDGSELFYISGTNQLMAVPVDMGSELDPIGRPVTLFSPRLRRHYFDVSPDGERFLLIERIDPEVDSITLVQNWTVAADGP